VRPDGNPGSTARWDISFTGIATVVRGPVCADPASLEGDPRFPSFDVRPDPVRRAHGRPTVRHIAQDYLRDGPERVLAELPPNLALYRRGDPDMLDAAIVPGGRNP
jgi:hypothetical protein